MRKSLGLNSSVVAMALMSTMAMPATAKTEAGASNPTPRTAQTEAIVRQQRKAKKGLTDRVIEPVQTSSFYGNWRNTCNHPLPNHPRGKKGKR